MSTTTINTPSRTLIQGAVSIPSPPLNRKPSNWPTDHRRVPSYRPINYALDPAERIVFNNKVEQGFITTMFFGLRIITVAHRVWTATGGRWRDDLFRYELGGEY